MARLSGVDLRKWYGQREVVRGVSPEVNQGEIVGLLGPNGAGKTTSFYMLTGIIKPSSGRVLLEDQDIGTWPLHERARVGISYLPQESSVFRKLTVRQNLQIILEHTGLPRKEQKERADVLLEDHPTGKIPRHAPVRRRTPASGNRPCAYPGTEIRPARRTVCRH